MKIMKGREGKNSSIKLSKRSLGSMDKMFVSLNKFVGEKKSTLSTRSDKVGRAHTSYLLTNVRGDYSYAIILETLRKLTAFLDVIYERVPSHAAMFQEGLNIGVLMDCGRTLYEAGDFNAAAGKFVEATQSQDSDIQALNNFCACKLKQEVYNEALSCAEQVLEVDPDNLKALARKWLACIQINETRQAADALSALEMRGRQAVGIEPGITHFSKQPDLLEA